MGLKGWPRLGDENAVPNPRSLRKRERAVPLPWYFALYTVVVVVVVVTSNGYFFQKRLPFSTGQNAWSWHTCQKCALYFNNRKGV